jgi:hypothetical protein
MRVLLIEDDSATAQSIELMLKSLLALLASNVTIPVASASHKPCDAACGATSDDG